MMVGTSAVPAVDLGLLAGLAANVVAVGGRGRQTAEVAGFETFLSPGGADYFMSFAVPQLAADGGADRRMPAEWAPSLDRLAAHFAAHGRALRLEFFAELHPHLATALQDAGIGLDKRAPVMALTPAAFRPPRRTGMDMTLVAAGDGLAVGRFMSVQSDAFGVRIDTGPAGWRPILEAGLANRSMIAAIGEIGGHACCGAVLMIGGGAAELAGVGTLPAFRRQGYAADICGRLLAAYFRRSGDPAWLSADDEIAEGLYGVLGFRAIGTQLNYGRRMTGSNANER